MAYDGERPEALEAMDQLEGILRDVAEELATWRTRAQKAETELKRAGPSGGAGGGGAAARGDRGERADPALEAENKSLRQRVEAARSRVHDLLQRLTFLEEQATGNGGGGGAGGGK